MGCIVSKSSKYVDKDSIAKRGETRLDIAKKAVDVDNHWKIFTHLDTQNELDMIQLSSFLRTIISTVPGLENNKEDLKMDDDDVQEFGNMSSVVIDIQESIKNHKKYDIGNNPITTSIVENIIEVYKKDGKLSSNLVTRILKKTYKTVKTLKTVNRMDPIQKGCKVTVVGDIHGQLKDLLHILSESGMPNSLNKYIFNGDFVDRGSNSIECIIVLFSLLITNPANVFLNRGNHEDDPVCRVYGFQAECVGKYDDLTFNMFCEIFKYLPLFTVVNDSIFVVHGGLFHDSHVKLSDLDDIQRHDDYYAIEDEYPDNCNDATDEFARREYLRQLQRDALWSDPDPLKPGLSKSYRGAGVLFGDNITKMFLKNNNLSMIIRSHQCVQSGFNLPYNRPNFSINDVCDQDKPLLCTLFSASNYAGQGDNSGAYLILNSHYIDDSYKAGNSELYYSVHRYKTSEASKSLTVSTKVSLLELLLKKKKSLTLALEAYDDNNNDYVEKNEFTEILERICNIGIDWIPILPSIVPSNCWKDETIHYIRFLESLSVVHKKESLTGGSMDAMYANRKKLEAIFYFFDTDGSGQIDRDEFRKGCELLNKLSHSDEEHKLKDVDHMMDLIDLTHSETININEFFEVILYIVLIS
jgi:serine/threonine-protein phosphatase with EF-hand domain